MGADFCIGGQSSRPMSKQPRRSPSHSHDLNVRQHPSCLLLQPARHELECIFNDGVASYNERLSRMPVLSYVGEAGAQELTLLFLLMQCLTMRQYEIQHFIG